MLFEMISSGEDEKLKLIARDLYCNIEPMSVALVNDGIVDQGDTPTIDNLLQTAEVVGDLNSFKKTDDVSLLTKKEATLTDLTSRGDECAPYAIDCFGGLLP